MRAIFATMFVLAAAPAAAGEFVVCDNGVRCVRAPCPSRNAVDLGTGERIRGVGLKVALSSGAADERLREGLYYGTAVVEGELQPRPGGAPGLTVSRHLRPSTDAERRLCRPSASPPKRS